VTRDHVIWATASQDDQINTAVIYCRAKADLPP
jgi:hypothetical protein